MDGGEKPDEEPTTERVAALLGWQISLFTRLRGRRMSRFLYACWAVEKSRAWRGVEVGSVMRHVRVTTIAVCSTAEARSAWPVVARRTSTRD